MSIRFEPLYLFLLLLHDNLHHLDPSLFRGLFLVKPRQRIFFVFGQLHFADFFDGFHQNRHVLVAVHALVFRRPFPGLRIKERILLVANSESFHR